jgi:hypothetical protein
LVLVNLIKEDGVTPVRLHLPASFNGEEIRKITLSCQGEGCIYERNATRLNGQLVDNKSVVGLLDNLEQIEIVSKYSPVSVFSLPNHSVTFLRVTKSVSVPTPTATPPIPTLTPTPTPTLTPTPTPTPRLVEREITLKVSSPQDDNFQMYGERNGSPFTINLGYVYQAMFRFNNVPVPPGAKILEAHLRLSPSWYQERYGKFPVFGEDAGNTLPANKQNIATRNLTDHSVYWQIATPWPSRKYQESPDLAPIIQEIIDRDDWNKNNSLTLITKENYQLYPGRRIYWSAYSYETNPSLAAELYIKYRYSSGQ